MAGATGLEPATFGVTGRVFIQRFQRLFRLFPRRDTPHFEAEVGTPHNGHFSREAKAERSRVRAAILAVRYLRDSI
jgi:hypothetical protein